MPARSWGACLVLALCAAVLLHLAPQRSSAAWLVLLIVPWGLLASAQRASLSLGRLLGIALLARALLVGTPPLLSDDLFRYLFEGLALNAGHNPFLEPPASLAQLDPQLAARVNHPEIPSIYPPVAQLWFRALALVGTGAWVAQAGMACVDLVNVGLIRRCTPETPWAALVYAVHPVAVLESSNGAHLEPLAVLFCLLTVLGLEQSRAWGATAMVLGAATKLLPVLFLPAAWRRLGGPGLATGGGLGVIVASLLALPVLSAGWGLLDAFGTYSAHWSFNGLLHPLLTPLLGDATRPLLALGGLVVAGVASRLPARSAWFVVGSGFLVLSPTVHPWYTLWALVPSLLLGRRDWAVASTSLAASYLVLATLDGQGGWAPQPWLGPLTWGGALAALYLLREPIPTAP